MKKHDESVVSIHAKRHQLSSSDDTSSSDENFDSSLDQSQLAIEVRSCNGNVRGTQSLLQKAHGHYNGNSMRSGKA